MGIYKVILIVAIVLIAPLGASIKMLLLKIITLEEFYKMKIRFIIGLIGIILLIYYIYGTLSSVSRVQ